ncbi:FtsW/RodA/SpoVE family cell cycle protein [Bacillaceae bacterium]
MEFEKRYWKEIDWSILLILLGFSVFSYIGISGATPDLDLEKKQLVWYGLGFILMLLVLLFDYRLFAPLSYGLYGFGILLLIGLLLNVPFAVTKNNATSWYQIGPVLFQPAEMMKLFTILTLAKYLSRCDEKEQPLERFYQLVPMFALVAVPFFLIFSQPDLGNALVFFGILVSMMVVGGVPLRHFAILGSLTAAGVLILAFLYQFRPDVFFEIIQPYQWKRIEYWLHPERSPLDEGFQLTQSLIAIGSGKLLGKGIDQGTQAKYGWLPIGESDFIFSVIAEQLGFLGSSLLILLFFLLLYRMVRIAMDAKDPFGSYLVTGVIGMFVFQIFENIGMTIQLMPITGITLPFISYGGSSVITNFVTIGLVLSVGMRKKTLMFD